jgi:DNA repair protein RadA/Sms
MTRIIGDESLHGRTYHITSTRPTPVSRLCRVFEELVVEMAADLAAAAALISSATDTPLPQGCVVFGEISLSGEIRAVGRAESRLREAQKLGFDRALTPPLTVRHKGVGVTSVTRLAEAVERISQNRY